MIFLMLALMGLCMGSFATMASYRLVHGGSFLGRSFCDKCKHKLGLKDLVPLFSWLLQKGRCNYCRAKISSRYPLTELLCLAGFMGLGFSIDHPFILGLLIMITTTLVIMVVVDFEHMIIPDEIQWIMAFLGIMFAYCNHYINPGTYPLIQVILMPLVCFIISYLMQYTFLKLMKKDGLGWGDIKFFTVSGLYLDLDSLSIFFLLSGIIGISISLLWRYLKKGEQFPFGPALAVSLYLCIVFPDIVGIIDLKNWL
jgi:leader peptidase (prepilin peptidase) / N-methyltransferase